MNALREKLARPEVIERFVSKFTQRATALQSAGPGSNDDSERRVRDGERRIANLTESLAKVGWSDALASKLREEEAQLGKLKAERSAAAKDNVARVTPHPAAISGYLKNLFGLLETDSVRGREILSRFVAPIVMTPEKEGSARRYRVTGAFNLAYFLAPLPSGSGKYGCAGRI